MVGTRVEEAEDEPRRRGSGKATAASHLRRRSGRAVAAGHGGGGGREKGERHHGKARPMVCYSRGVIDSLVDKLTDVKKTHPKVHPLLTDLVGLQEDLVNKLAGGTHSQVKAWMKQNRQLFYNIEDMIDLKLGKTKDVHESDEDFEEQINEFRARIEEARDRSNRYDLLDKAPTSDTDRQDAAPSKVSFGSRLIWEKRKEGVLVGIGGPRKELEDHLADTQKKKKVVSVLGIGGLGKTTLATKVYKELKGQFDCYASVTMGRNSSTAALMDALLQVNPEMVGQALNEQVIIPKLWNFLKNKRYLVFIDDIQNEHAWRVINRALPNNELRSRILVTTRVKNVAMSCSVPPIDVIYEMKCLDEIDSKKLLDSMIPTETGASFEKQCHDMLKMCYDLPLAIIVTCGLLALKSADLGSLKKLEESTLSMLDQYSSSDGMRHVLDICFADLSPPVKACFLYLSTFPENYAIKKGHLIWRWVAEGFIPKTRQASMWKTGEGYFNELVCRRLIQPVFCDSDDQPVACTVHPVIHDFIASLSRQEDFHTTAAELISGPFPNGTIRRFSVDCRRQENNEADTLKSIGINLPRVRSLTVFGAAGSVLDLGTFKHLRVLDLENNKSFDDQQVEKIELLFLLRYLGLAGTNITNLPQQIMALQHLVTLDLRRTKVRELPSFGNKKLQSLFAPFISIPKGMGGMEELEELSGVLLDGSHADDMAGFVSNTSRLRVLGVKFGDIAETKRQGMMNFLQEVEKSNLQSISLDDYPCDSVALLVDCWAHKRLDNLGKLELRIYNFFPQVPADMASMIALTHLHIEVKELEAQGVRALGKLPKLILLELFSEKSSRERLSVSREDGFESLKVFSFWSSYLEGMELQFKEGAMPHLHRLQIEFNARKTKFLDGIQHLCYLFQLCANIRFKDATYSEAKAAEADIRDQVSKITYKQADNSTTSTVDIKISILPESFLHLPHQVFGTVIQFVLGTLRTSIDLSKNHKQKLGRVMNKELAELMEDLNCLRNCLRRKSYDEVLLTELVHDIEDFAQALLIPGAFRGCCPVLAAIVQDPRDKYVDRIKYFREEIRKLQQKSTESKWSEQGGGSSVDTFSSDPASSSAAGGYPPEESLVGISKPKQVILELLREAASSEQAEAGGQDAKKPPKVISIVGCPGVGKTALARAVYDQYHYVPSAASSSRDARAVCFDCVAWVEAAGCNDETALLQQILQKVEADLASRGIHTVEPSEGDGNDASKKLRGILADKRYLVFIDDVQQAKVLHYMIHDHFPKNAKSGMVLVTTSVHQVANVCSRGGYVYTMKCLDDTDSENLFCRLDFGNHPKEVSSALRPASRRIIAKCGGLPLALISVAKHLSINARNVDFDYFDKVAKELGSHLAGSSNTDVEFMELRRALEQCYESLPNYLKTYMLSLSIFPMNHPIRCKSLIRRLVAEGLVVAGNDRECLDELVNRCIVEPIQISSFSNDVKTFQVNVGIMLEFIIHKSLSTNFVTLIQEEEVMRNQKGRIRRLSVQSNSKDKFQEVAVENEMSETIRSLTIIPRQERCEVSKIIKSCKFLRLLDLESCTGIDQNFFKGICKLVYLKYLSLRKTDVKKIPRQIKNLRCLQTLDIRETQEMGLPKEVITLPELAFLFGKFVLPKMSNKTKEFLELKSQLRTIAEFVVKQWKGSEHIILKARKLRKVKFQCRDTSNTDFFLSLQKCFASLESVSIKSDQLQDIMYSLERRPYSIRSMKLWGKLDSLPGIGTLDMMNYLNKLQLSCTELTCNALSVLQNMRFLEYLKLLDNKNDSWVGSFSVLEGGFESLQLLCFQASKLPKLEFQSGSMVRLTSLQLLCPDMSQMQAVEYISNNIKHITSLNEVILHSSANKAIVDAWKTAAKSNPSGPCVTTSTCS